MQAKQIQFATADDALNYLAELPIGKKFKILGDMYKEMHEVPAHIEQRWKSFHEHTRAMVEAKKEGREFSVIRRACAPGVFKIL
jgi:hypothetical protein